MSKFKDIITLEDIIVDNDKSLSTEDENFLYDKFIKYDFSMII